MLLRRLKEYADQRMQLPPTLYSETPVRYIFELDDTGRLLNPTPTDTADPSSPQTKRGLRRPMPQVQRSSGIRPLLLADKADYTLGIGGEKAKPDRTAACHAAYLELLERCAAVTNQAAVIAVRDFLRGNILEQIHLPDDFDPGANITFRVNDDFPTDFQSVQAFWAAENDPSLQGATVMQCIVCGNERPVLASLQGKIKGVPGGQTSGTAIISANAKAFESYGLEQSLIAPTCADCGERFTKALNKLLSDKESRVIIAGSAFVFWTRENVGFNFGSFLTDANAQQVKDLLDSVRVGKRMPDVDETAFYALILTPSGGRAVVRDWMDTTVGEARRRLALWFERQRIISDRGGEIEPVGIYGLAGATVYKLEDLPPTTPRALLRGALMGTPLPMGLLYQAVRRCRAEQSVTRQRAVLIKLVLLSQRSEVLEGTMVDLDLDNDSPAYRCGRLLAVLAEAQENAIGKAAIVDRFYGTASSAPASVFGRLLRGAQPHLAKLERDRPTAASALQRRLEEIMSGLKGFPTTLTLEEQGLFALGFYHQRAHDRAQMIANAERKRARDGQGSPEA